MRASAALTALLALAVPAAAPAADCRFDESDIPPLRVWDRIVVLQRAYTCSHDARGTLLVTFRAGGVKVGEARAKIEPRGKWPQRGRLLEKLWPSKLCPAEPPRGAQGRIEGVGDDQEVVYDVPVTAEITGTGELAALGWKGTVAFACRLCPSSRGSIAIQEGRAHARTLTAKSRIVASADAAWLACAGSGADLSLRFLPVMEEGEASSAVRPLYVLEHLERGWRRDGERAHLDVPAPHRELCRAAGKGKRQLLWEVFGRGELMRLGGGGRSTIDLDCR